MDSLAFDGYSTPRTPSPTVSALPHMYSKQEYMFPQQDDAFNRPGSLLQELYEDIPEQSPAYYNNPNTNWHQQQRQEFPMMRRATFPYVRQDRDDAMPQYPNFIQQQQQQQQVYSSYEDQYTDFDDTNIKIEENAALMVPSQQFYRPQQQQHHHQQIHHQQQQHHSYHHSPYPSPSLNGGAHPSYLSPHTGLPVQHTDDAASKETQYLRRRCFNCHTTEPPSWRRSTLNPGKIVCNKCGLYERTHLRPRPLRFDELRAGNKARKAGAAGVGAAANNKLSTSPNPNVSPKQAKLVKKEPREFSASGAQGAILRRSSVSSSASSVHSGSGASDWDDNVSIYSSSGSAPPTSYNSPIQHTYPLSRSDSSSPPSSLSQLQHPSSNEGGIRLPNNPLSDLMHQQQQQQQQQYHQQQPRKSHTAPGGYFSNGGSAAGSPALSNKGLDHSNNGSPASEHASLGNAVLGVGASPVLVGSS